MDFIFLYKFRALIRLILHVYKQQYFGDGDFDCIHHTFLNDGDIISVQFNSCKCLRCIAEKAGRREEGDSGGGRRPPIRQRGEAGGGEGEGGECVEDPATPVLP